jgi:exodeoxyribonuclease-3
VRIATWNVNSVRARLPRVLPWLEIEQPDVLCLQETKVQDGDFPAEAFRALGYEAAFHGQKSYNGVAILSRLPLGDVVMGFPGDPVPHEARAILVNLYVVNGEAVGSEKYAKKLAWLRALTEHVHALHADRSRLVLTGDFNITFDDRDVYDPHAWREKILCSTPEREALALLMQDQLHDGLRLLDPGGGIFTWWDFRLPKGLERNLGLRIDHFLVAAEPRERLTRVAVDVIERGREKPSDHAPVVATFAD